MEPKLLNAQGNRTETEPSLSLKKKSSLAHSVHCIDPSFPSIRGLVLVGTVMAAEASL